jgi:hypothetical protein
MIYIKRFIEKVSLLESKQNKDFIMPITEARGLRDELAKMLAEYYEKNTDKQPTEEPVIQIELKGGSFK